MFSKKLEVFDPEYPTIYYYTNNSTNKPQSLNERCSRGRKVTGYNFKSSKVMVILGLLYVGFLTYISIEKPKFALEYAQEKNRQANFSQVGIHVTTSTTVFWLQNKFLLNVTLKNSTKNKKTIQIDDISYQLDESPFQKIKLDKNTLEFSERAFKNLFLEIPLNKGGFMPKQAKISLTLNGEKKFLKLVI